MWTDPSKKAQWKEGSYEEGRGMKWYKWADVVYDVSDPVNPKVVHYKVGMKDNPPFA